MYEDSHLFIHLNYHLSDNFENLHLLRNNFIVLIEEWKGL